MYRVYILEYNQEDNTLAEGLPLTVHDDENSNSAQKLVSPVLTLEDNAAGSFTCTVPVENVGYSYIRTFKTTFIVKRRVINPPTGKEPWETIWEGRVISMSMDLYNQKSVTCEGALAYLNDNYVPKWGIFTQYSSVDVEYNNNKVQLKAIFDCLLRGFNSSVMLYGGSQSVQILKTHDRRVFVSNSDIPYYYGDNLLDFSSDYETVLEYITNSIIGRYGGHVRVRKRYYKAGDSGNPVPDPTDEVQTTSLKGLYLEYVEEYYSLDLGRFSTVKAYSKGDHVIQNEKVYRFKVDHNAGSFNSNEVEQLPNVKIYKIEFKKNLENLERVIDGTDWCTAVLVTGGKNERYTDQDLHKIVYPDNPHTYGHDAWLKGNNGGAVTMADHQLDEIIRADYPMISGFYVAKVSDSLSLYNEPVHYADIQPCYVINSVAASNYGIIAKQISLEYSVKKNENPEPGDYKYNYEASAILYRAGVEYLKLHAPGYYSITVTAMDFNFVDPDTPYADVGDIFYVVSPIHGVSIGTYFILTRMSIPLDSPESTTFTLNRQNIRDISKVVGRPSVR